MTGAKTVNGEIVSQDVENGHSLKRVENKGGDEKINKTDSLQPQQNSERHQSDALQLVKQSSADAVTGQMETGSPTGS